MFGASSGFGSTAASTPFGSTPSTTPAFGSPPAAAPSAPFGSAAPPAGTSAFGSPTPTTAPGFGTFGAAAPASAGTGAFGTAPTTFGSPPNTAAGTSTAAFGSSTPTTTPFGTSNAFGSTSTTPSTGIFGGAPSTTSAFGAGNSNAASSFGTTFGSTAATPPTTTFGTSTFGASAPAPGTSLFNSSVPNPPSFGTATNTAPPAFGSPAPAAPGGLFGPTTPAAAPSGSLFGAPPAAGAAAVGSKLQPYQVTSKTDGGSTINLQSITAMTAYEAKSFEELRFEDYSAGNRGDANSASATTTAFGAAAFGSSAPATTGLFGPPAPAPSVFGSATFGSNAPAPAPFSAPAPGTQPSSFTFGTPAPAPSAFGSTFGTAKPASTSIFGGAPAPAPAATSLFGTTAPAPGSGLFGTAPATNNLFGTAPAPAPGASIFGSAPAPAPLFGSTPAPAPTTGLFGTAPAPSPGTSLFGTAPASTSVFGSTTSPPPAFGAAAPAAPGSGLFSSAPASAPTGTLFGTAKPPGASLFSAAPASAPTSTFGSVGGFGAAAAVPAQASGSLFGTPPAPPNAGAQQFPSVNPAATNPLSPFTATTIIGPTAAAPMSTADALLARQIAAMEEQKKELESLEAWRGNRLGGSGVVIPTSLSERDAMSAAAAAMVSDSNIMASPPSFTAMLSSSASPFAPSSPRSATKIRPRGVRRTTPALSSIDRVQNGSSRSTPILSPDAYVGSTIKQLVIRPNSLGRPTTRLRLTPPSAAKTRTISRPNEDDAMVSRDVLATTDSPTPVLSPVASPNNVNGTSQTTTPALVVADRSGETPCSAPNNNDNNNKHVPVVTDDDDEKNDSTTPEDTRGSGIAYDYYRSVVGSPENGVISPTNTAKAAVPPKLTSIDYITSPSIDVLKAMSEAQLTSVSNFSIERSGIGSIAWDDPVDLRDVDLDAVVRIDHLDVAVYDADEAAGTKPAEGTKLNKPAVITMHKVFANENGTAADASTLEKFKRKITKRTKKMGADLLSFDADQGIWKFRVPHFSRYCLGDDDDDDEAEEDMIVVEQETEPSSHFLQNDQATPAKVTFAKVSPPSRARFALHADDEDDDNDDEDGDVAMSTETESGVVALIGGVDSNAVLRDAENAYEMLEVNEQKDENTNDASGNSSPLAKDLSQFESPDLRLKDEGSTFSAYCRPKTTPISIETRRTSISARLARKHGLIQTSDIDYGLRMGRSFRVGWKSDGSFVQPGLLTASIVAHRPVFHDESKMLATEDLLNVHMRYSVRSETTSRPHQNPTAFSIPKLSGRQLCSALTSYIQACKRNTEGTHELDHKGKAQAEAHRIMERAFTLLMHTCARENGEDEVTAGRQIKGFQTWLKLLCEADVSVAVDEALSKDDVYAAVFAALSGGDLSLASSIATKSSPPNHRLASLLLSSGSDSRKDVQEQIRCWRDSGAVSLDKFPPYLFRILMLLSGDLSVEEHKFRSGADTSLDWRRRIAVRLHFGQESDLCALIDGYSANVLAGKSPFASPRYSDQHKPVTSSASTCLLFRLMICLNQKSAALCDIVEPLGHTHSAHDFSTSFHLSAVLSVLGLWKPLTPIEEARLVDGFVAQLVSCGLWQWAIYVVLCVQGQRKSGKLYSSELAVRQHKAKQLLFAFFQGKQHYEFLKLKVGIPQWWFDEVLSARSVYRGNAYGYVQHLSQFSMENAMEAFELYLLPRLLFVGSEHLQTAMDLVERYGKEDVRAYFNLSRKVMSLIDGDGSERQSNEQASGLLELAEETRNSFLNCADDLRRENRGKPKIKMLPEYEKIPQDVLVSEALSGLAFLQLQLKALQLGQPVVDEGVRGKKYLKYASQLARLCLASSQEDSFAEFATGSGTEEMFLRASV